MSGSGPKTRKIKDSLDALGNTTAAIGKGFAIGSSALTALALFAFTQSAGIRVIDITNPMTVIDLFLGGYHPRAGGRLTMTLHGRLHKALWKRSIGNSRRFQDS